MIGGAMIRYLPLLLSCVFAAACGRTEAPLVASDIVIKRPVPGMQMSAGYLALKNESNEPITITRVSSPQFGSVQLHETRDEDGISRMVELDVLTIPPSSQVDLAPGGKHLMLMNPLEDLGTVSLEFYSGDTVVLRIDATPGD
jgi:copper(I)-binding protein